MPRIPIDCWLIPILLLAVAVGVAKCMGGLTMGGLCEDALARAIAAAIASFRETP